MKRTVKHALCIALAVLLAAGVLLPAVAADLKKGEDKELAVAFFNDGVNAVKVALPRATVSYKNYVPENGITAGEGKGGEEVDELVQKYLIPVLEGLFNNRSSVAKSFIQTLMGKEQMTEDTREVHRGEKRDKTVPVYGEPYVSALEAADDFDVFTENRAGSQKTGRIAVLFNDTTLAQAKQGSLAKAFSLPEGNFDPTVLSGERNAAVTRLDNARFQRFDIRNAKLVAKFDKDGLLTYYGSTIDYCFAISFADSMNLVSVVLGYDFYAAVLNTINTVYANMGKTAVDANAMLQQRQIYVTYRCTVEITDLLFGDRYFGDVDDNDEVNAVDARMALRHAVLLEQIERADDRIYTDVDFDGEINAADARQILRMSVKLEPLFTAVPEGKEIKIAVPETPDEPDEPGEAEEPAPDDTGLFDEYDPSVQLEDVVNAVFSYIASVDAAEQSAHNYIADFIGAIKDTVDENKEYNVPETEEDVPLPEEPSAPATPEDAAEPPAATPEKTGAERAAELLGDSAESIFEILANGFPGGD